MSPCFSHVCVGSGSGGENAATILLLSPTVMEIAAATKLVEHVKEDFPAMVRVNCTSERERERRKYL